jgi:hypothetical protein
MKALLNQHHSWSLGYLEKTTADSLMEEGRRRHIKHRG